MRDGFWGSPFTRLVRERGYEPAMHVAYSRFLFPLDSPALLRDLHDWYLGRSWVDAHNLRVRFGATLGLPPEPPLPEPRPRTVAWSGVLRIEQPASYVLRLGPRAHALVLGGVVVPLHRNDAVPDAPSFAPVRLDPGLYPFVATQTGDDLDGRLDVQLSRLSFDDAGCATPPPAGSHRPGLPAGRAGPAWSGSATGRFVAAVPRTRGPTPPLPVDHRRLPRRQFGWERGVGYGPEHRRAGARPRRSRPGA